MKKVSLLLCSLVIATLSFAQSFEGKITAAVKAISLPDEMKGMEAMVNQDITIFMKGAKTKTEMKSLMGSQVYIFDTLSHEMIILMDLMGQKYAIKQTVEDNESSGGMDFDLKGADVQITDETRKIAGYNCKKAIAHIKNEDHTEANLDFWFTDEVNVQNGQLPFNGILMEYVMEVEGMTFQYTVSDISKQSVGASEFETPSGYHFMTPEEMNELFPTIGNE